MIFISFCKHFEHKCKIPYIYYINHIIVACNVLVSQIKLGLPVAAQLDNSDIESKSSGLEESDNQNSDNDVRVISKDAFDVNTDRVGNTKL